MLLICLLENSLGNLPLSHTSPSGLLGNDSHTVHFVEGNKLPKAEGGGFTYPQIHRPFFVQFGSWLVLVQQVETSSSCSAWKGTTEPAPRKCNASRQSGNLPQVWAALGWIHHQLPTSHFPLKSLKNACKTGPERDNGAEYAWRMFQRGGEQEERMPCPPHQPSALQCPILPMLAELGIAQQAAPLFVLSHASHTPLFTAGSRGEDDATPEPLFSLLSALLLLTCSSFQPPSWLPEGDITAASRLGSAGEKKIVLPFAHQLL